MNLKDQGGQKQGTAYASFSWIFVQLFLSKHNFHITTIKCWNLLCFVVNFTKFTNQSKKKCIYQDWGRGGGHKNIPETKTNSSWNIILKCHRVKWPRVKRQTVKVTNGNQDLHTIYAVIASRNKTIEKGLQSFYSV